MRYMEWVWVSGGTSVSPPPPHPPPLSQLGPSHATQTSPSKAYYRPPSSGQSWSNQSSIMRELLMENENMATLALFKKSYELWRCFSPHTTLISFCGRVSRDFLPPFFAQNSNGSVSRNIILFTKIFDGKARICMSA